MLLAGLGAIIPAGANIFYRLPGPKLEDNKGVLKDDRVASLQVLIIIPLIIGVVQAIATMLSYRIALYASGGVVTAQNAALVTFVLASWFSSLSVKFDGHLLQRLRQIGKIGACTLGLCVFVLLLTAFKPLNSLWQSGAVGSGFSFWILFFAALLAVIPLVISEWMKFLKKDDPAQGRDS